MNKRIYVTPEHILDYIDEKSKPDADKKAVTMDIPIEDREFFIKEDM
jgi:hypothetical protein